MNQGTGNTGSIITGNTPGEKKPEQAYEQSITFFLLSVIVGVLHGGGDTRFLMVADIIFM